MQVIIPEYLDRDSLIKIIKEFDRRCYQLWDKVLFERKYELVDYDKLD